MIRVSVRMNLYDGPSQDMISYNKEQAAGNEGHNIISTVMFELGLDIGGAMAWATHNHAEVQKRFIEGSFVGIFCRRPSQRIS
jgi:hypothetical protein